MLGKWKNSSHPVKRNMEAMPFETSPREESSQQRRHVTAERKQLNKGLYFCLVQSLPSPSCFVFPDTGDYIIGCSCIKSNSCNLVTLPLGASTECRGSCYQLRVKVRAQHVAIRQSLQTSTSSNIGKENRSMAFQFVKEIGSKSLELFAHLDSAEDCNFRMFPVNNVNGKAPAPNSFSVCSFSIRRVLLGADRPSCASTPGVAMDVDSCRITDELSLTEREISVSNRFEVFSDLRIGKGGNGEVFLGIHRTRGEAVAVKREPKDMLRHEFSLIMDVRLNGPLISYKAHEPHPSKFLGLLVHSVAIEVGNSSVAAAIAHHSAKGDDHDHLVLELVSGGELRKLIKTKYSAGMPLEMARAYIYQIVCGLVLIHAKRIIHRDLKTQNILVRHGDTFQGDELKIIDFGNSVKVKPGCVLSKNYTTCFACAPEQFALPRKGYGYAIDIWAVGTIFFELLTGERLFDCLNFGEASRQIPAFKERDVKARLPNLRPDAQEFLFSCLTKDQEMRPTALQLLTTSFLFPLHIYQIRRRVEITDVYNSYMKAFEKGWGDLQPIDSLSVVGSLFYDSAANSFRPQNQDVDVVNVVLPVFECVPDFKSQDRGIQIHNWILGSNASFHVVSSRLEELARGSCDRPFGRCSTTSRSSSRNNSVHSVASTRTSYSLEQGCSNPGFNKVFQDKNLSHSLSNLAICGQTVQQCSFTCSTASLGSPMPASLLFGGTDHATENEAKFDELEDRIDSL
ncbi:hypothetical protein Efla_005055 [Eimeria flavescens]